MSKKSANNRGKNFEPSFTKLSFGSTILDQSRNRCLLAAEVAKRKGCPTNDEYNSAMDYFSEGLSGYRQLLDAIKGDSNWEVVFAEYKSFLKIALIFAAKMKSQCESINSRVSEQDLRTVLSSLDKEMEKVAPTDTNIKPPYVPNPLDTEEFAKSVARRVYDRTFIGGCDFPDFKSYSGAAMYKELFDKQIILPIQFQAAAEGGVNGVMLYGPPGTGKTSLVRTVLGELANSGNPAILIALSGSDLKGPFVGNIETALAIVFRQAKLYTENGRRAVLIFIDEADSIFWGSDKGGPDVNNAGISEFKTQTENINPSERNIMNKIHIFIATNFPGRISEDVRSRFEKRIYVPDPTFNETRGAILLNIKDKIGGWESVNFANTGDASIQAQRIDMGRKEFIWTHPTQNLWQPYPHSVGKFPSISIPWARSDNSRLGEFYNDELITNPVYQFREFQQVLSSDYTVAVNGGNVMQKGIYFNLPSELDTQQDSDWEKIVNFSFPDHVYSDAELFIYYAMNGGYDISTFFSMIYDRMKDQSRPC